LLHKQSSDLRAIRKKENKGKKSILQKKFWERKGCPSGKWTSRKKEKKRNDGEPTKGRLKKKDSAQKVTSQSPEIPHQGDGLVKSRAAKEKPKG